MKIKVNYNPDDGPIKELGTRKVAAVPRRGDHLSLDNQERTVYLVDWFTGADSDDVAASVWVR